MGSETNRQWILAQRPDGNPTEDDFELVESSVPDPGSDEVLVRTLYLSVDPYMRERMRDTGKYMSMSQAYAEPWPTGEVMPAGAVGEVVESNHASFESGDVVTGQLRWAEYATVQGSQLTPVDPSLAPVSASLGVLGMPGQTAYFGMLEVGDPNPGDTVVVSGAAGAVGSIACQIAKLNGCRVVGTAGTDEKIAYLTDELGIDDGINYRTSDVEAAVEETCPDGIDVYFDNVGGEITDAVIPLLNVHGRVAVCGQIALYNEEGVPVGPRKLWKLVEKRARIEGFVYSDFIPRREEANEQLARWIDEGKLEYRETIIEGIENAPEAFRGLFDGVNVGKLLVQVAEGEFE